MAVNKNNNNNNKNTLSVRQVIDIKNQALNGMISKYLKEKTVKNLDEVAALLKNAVVLVPGMKDANGGVTPVLIKTQSGVLVLPCFTGSAQLMKSPNKTEAVLTMPFMALAQAALGAKAEVVGISVNPYSENLTLTRALLELMRDNKKVADQPVPEGTKVKLKVTEEMANQLERFNFETVALPGSFFKDPKALSDRICSEREEAVDALFEASYQNKRMYPYRTDEFSVFSFTPDENTEVIRIHMPERMLKPGNAMKIYMILNDANYRYFTIIQGKDQDIRLVEVLKDSKRVDHGEAPEEGAELYVILKIAGIED